MRPETDPDTAWVSALAGDGHEAAVNAVLQARSDRTLFRHLEREHAREGRSSYVEIDAPLELFALTRLLRPDHVLEVGVSSGVSSAYILAALRRNGHGTLHSVDLPSRARPGSNRRPTASWSLPPGRESGWAVPLRLRENWDLRLGDKRDLLPRIADELPDIELLVYDVPHDDVTTRHEFRRLDPRFPAGGVAIADHGPGGGLCRALASWAGRRRARPIRRTGLGLYGARMA